VRAVQQLLWQYRGAWINNRSDSHPLLPYPLVLAHSHSTSVFIGTQRSSINTWMASANQGTLSIAGLNPDMACRLHSHDHCKYLSLDGQEDVIDIARV
jgi:hypothetical protein